MILNHADAVFRGENPVVRIYCNGRLVWSLGEQVSGLVKLLLSGSVSGSCEDITVLQLHTAGELSGAAIPGTCGLTDIAADADGASQASSAARLSGINRSIGSGRAWSDAFAAGRTYGMVFTRGEDLVLLSGTAVPHSVDTVYANGTGALIAVSGDAHPIPERPLSLDARCLSVSSVGEGHPSVSGVQRSWGAAFSSLTAVVGAGSARQYTVTFLCDGVVLHSAVVIEGDDCPDPVELGCIETPTRTESGVPLLFSGWSTTENGGAEADALKNVTEDRSVYAAFQSGSSSEALDGDTWETISARSVAGIAEEHYKVGDTKTVILTDSEGQAESIQVVIAGFNLHRNTEGVKDGITWIAQWRSTDTIKIAGEIETTVQAMLPADLLSVIRPSTIDTYQTGAVLTTTTPNLFRPELTNISDTLTNPSGGDEFPAYATALVTVPVELYVNPNDAEVFPLFSGMSKEEIAAFFSLEADGDALGTRSLAYGKKNAFTSNVTGAIVRDSTYTLVKKPVQYATYTFCFRT